MTKGEIKQKAAEEMRFVMINSSFSNKSAVKAIRDANSGDTSAESESFKD